MVFMGTLEISLGLYIFFKLDIAKHSRPEFLDLECNVVSMWQIVAVLQQLLTSICDFNAAKHQTKFIYQP